VYTVLIRYFTKPIVWISIVGTGVGLLSFAIFLQMHHTENYVNIENEEKKNKTIGRLILALCYILYGLSFIFLCMILCWFKSIRISIAVLQTASVVMLRNVRIVFVPIIATAFVLCYIGAWIVLMVCIVSCANIDQPSGNSQLKIIDFDGKEYLIYYMVGAVFGLFWICEFIIATFQYMIIVGTCTWYFTCHDE